MRAIATHVVPCVGHTKMVEQIEMPFTAWTRVGSGSLVLDGGPDPHGNGHILRKHRPGKCTGRHGAV